MSYSDFAEFEQISTQIYSFIFEYKFLLFIQLVSFPKLSYDQCFVIIIIIITLMWSPIASLIPISLHSQRQIHNSITNMTNLNVCNYIVSSNQYLSYHFISGWIHRELSRSLNITSYLLYDEKIEEQLNLRFFSSPNSEYFYIAYVFQ